MINQLKGSLNRKDSEYLEKYNILNNEYQKINKTLNNSISKMVNESGLLENGLKDEVVYTTDWNFSDPVNV